MRRGTIKFPTSSTATPPEQNCETTNYCSFFTAALPLGISPAHAVSCTAEIAQFELAVRQSAGNPNAGLFGRPSIDAQIDRQPTPASIKLAKERAQAQFAATLVRAKRLDAQGNRAGCARALTMAKDMYNLH